MLESVCLEHSGHSERIKNLEEENDDQWKSINASHRRIDVMKNWVIAGMASLIMQLLIMIAGILSIYLKLE